MPSPITPADTAFIDQALAESGRRLDALLASFRETVAEGKGETQAIANIAMALLISKTLMPPHEAEQMLIVAVIRLGRQEDRNHEQ